MAVFLLKAKHGLTYMPPKATGMFQDVPTNYWAAAWIEQLAREGITSGCSVSPAQYCPGATKKTVVEDLKSHGFPELTAAAMYRAGKLLVKAESLVKLEKAERRK